MKVREIMVDNMQENRQQANKKPSHFFSTVDAVDTLPWRRLVMAFCYVYIMLLNSNLGFAQSTPSTTSVIATLRKSLKEMHVVFYQGNKKIQKVETLKNESLFRWLEGQLGLPLHEISNNPAANANNNTVVKCGDAMYRRKTQNVKPAGSSPASMPVSMQDELQDEFYFYKVNCNALSFINSHRHQLNYEDESILKPWFQYQKISSPNGLGISKGPNIKANLSQTNHWVLTMIPAMHVQALGNTVMIIKNQNPIRCDLRYKEKDTSQLQAFQCQELAISLPGEEFIEFSQFQFSKDDQQILKLVGYRYKDIRDKLQRPKDGPAFDFNLTVPLKGNMSLKEVVRLKRPPKKQSPPSSVPSQEPNSNSAAETNLAMEATTATQPSADVAQSSSTHTTTAVTDLDSNNENPIPANENDGFEMIELKKEAAALSTER